METTLTYRQKYNNIKKQHDETVQHHQYVVDRMQEELSKIEQNMDRMQQTCDRLRAERNKYRERWKWYRSECTVLNEQIHEMEHPPTNTRDIPLNININDDPDIVNHPNPANQSSQPIISPITTTEPNLSNIDMNVISDTDPLQLTNLRPISSSTNNWTDKNTETLRNWKASISKASFIYEAIIEKFKRFDNVFSGLVYAAGVVATFIATISASLDMTTYPAAIFRLIIINAIIAAASAVFSEILRRFKWKDKVKDFSNFVERLDAFYSTVAGELILPINLRQDAIEFIRRNNETYMSIMKDSPQISLSNHADASKKYAKFLEDSGHSFKCAQKYKENDSIIDIV